MGFIKFIQKYFNRIDKNRLKRRQEREKYQQIAREEHAKEVGRIRAQEEQRENEERRRAISEAVRRKEDYLRKGISKASKDRKRYWKNQFK